jgi:hypothetical protein
VPAWAQALALAPRVYFAFSGARPWDLLWGLVKLVPQHSQAVQRMDLPAQLRQAPVREFARTRYSGKA